MSGSLGTGRVGALSPPGPLKLPVVDGRIGEERPVEVQMDDMVLTLGWELSSSHGNQARKMVDGIDQQGQVGRPFFLKKRS